MDNCLHTCKKEQILITLALLRGQVMDILASLNEKEHILASLYMSLLLNVN